MNPAGSLRPGAGGGTCADRFRGGEWPGPGEGA